MDPLFPYGRDEISFARRGLRETIRGAGHGLLSCTFLSMNEDDLMYIFVTYALDAVAKT